MYDPPSIESAAGRIPCIGFAAHSGAGKTTLLKALIGYFLKHAIRVVVIKHAHHDFDTDVPGKDSYELRKAGAGEVIINSSRRRAHITEWDDNTPSSSLVDLLSLPDPVRTDLILIEGFKSAPVPKIEVHRPSLGKPMFAGEDHHIIAIASDEPVLAPEGTTCLDLNNPPGIGLFIQARFLSTRIFTDQNIGPNTSLSAN